MIRAGRPARACSASAATRSSMCRCSAKGDWITFFSFATRPMAVSCWNIFWMSSPMAASQVKSP